MPIILVNSTTLFSISANPVVTYLTDIMRFSPLAALALTTGCLVEAWTIPSSQHKPRELGPDDIVVIKDGIHRVMKKSQYHAKNAHLLPRANLTRLIPKSTRTTEAPSLSKRCKSQDIITENPIQTFLNWDVAMSSVVHATVTDATVAVTEGYQVANSIAVSVTATLSTIENFLSVAYGLTVSETWTSTYDAAYTFNVPPGYYGAVVSNPMTTRRTGFIDSGCVGEGQRETYQSDSYSSKAYGGLSWVDGTISLCTGTEYPLPNCIGDGSIS
jgi:hypothetical protein